MGHDAYLASRCLKKAVVSVEHPQARGEHRGNGVEVATREQAADLSHDARVDLLDVLVGGRRQWVKAKGAIGPLVLDPLGDQSMKM